MGRQTYRRLTVDWTENNRRRLSSSIISCSSSWSVIFFGCCWMADDTGGSREEMLIGIRNPHPSESWPSKTARWITKTSVSDSQTSCSISSLQAVPFFNSTTKKLKHKKQRPYMLLGWFLYLEIAPRERWHKRVVIQWWVDVPFSEITFVLFFKKFLLFFSLVFGRIYFLGHHWLKRQNK